MWFTRAILFFLFAALTFSGYGQEKILWASKVLSFSSQYGEKEYSADQVLGVPNALGTTNKNFWAWVPKKESSSTGEYLEVAFEDALRTRQVAIGESLNPGAIYRIYLIDTKGNKYKVFENKSPRNILQPFRLFRHTFPKTNYYVSGLRLELKTKSVAGSNQIDGIAISDSGVPIRATVDEIQYEEELPTPELLGREINSEYAERLPIISPDGNTLFFARKYHPQNIGDDNQDDIWTAKKGVSGKWSFATNVGSPLNNKEHNFAVSFNPTGDVLFLGNEYKSKNKDGISFSRKIGRSWSFPVNMEIEDMYNKNTFVSYHVSLEGSVLLMSVERDDGLGDRDLYVSFRKNNNSWSKPLNVGNAINTVSVESSAFLAADGKTLYFSSNGHAGYGGLDMFMCRRLDETWTNWSTPKNLGEGINTPNNEYNYSIPAKGDYAYFSSDEPSGMSNIYQIKLPAPMRPDPVVLYSGEILDGKTLKPLGKAEIKISGLENSNEKSSLVSLGNYQFAMPYGEDVEVHAEIDGYYTISQSLNLSGRELEEMDYDNRDIANPANSINDEELDELKEKLSKLEKEIRRLENQRTQGKSRPELIETGRVEIDPELAALKRKFQESQGGEEVSENMRTQSKASSGDKELDNLRKKLGQYNEEEKQDEIKDLPAQTTAKDDAALEDMKRRYQQYIDGAPADEKETAKEVNNRPAKSELDFDFVREKIREELLASLLPQVIDDLQYRLKPKVIKQLQGDLPEDEKTFSLDPQTVFLLDQRLENNPLILSYPKVNRTNFRDLKPDLEKAMRKQIKESVIAELEDKYEPLMERHIQQEFSYLVKKEMEASLELKLLSELEKRESFKPSETVTTKESKPKPFVREYKEQTIDLVAIPLEKGQTIPLNNIFFDANQSKLKGISTTELNRVLFFLKKHPSMIVEIGGHTNGWCSHEYANELSQNRALAVSKYFIENGIPEKRIQHRGYGKTKPIDTNETVSGRKKNQRVELKILSMGG